MPLLEADYCDKEPFGRPRKEVGLSWDYKESSQVDTDLDWPRKARDQYEIRKRVQRVYRWCQKKQNPSLDQIRRDRLRESFRTLADQWLEETKYLSITSKAVSHHAYFAIVAMGPKVIPLIMEELRDRPAQWFVALRALAGFDPSPTNSSPSAARRAWLEWGVKNGYLEWPGKK